MNLPLKNSEYKTLFKRTVYIFIGITVVYLFFKLFQYVPQYYFEKGAEYEKNGKYTQAFQCYSRAIIFSEKNENYYYQRGKLIYHKQYLTFDSNEDSSIDSESSEADFIESVKLNPKNFMSYFFLGLIYLKKEKAESSIEYFSKVININSNMYDAYYWRGYGKKNSKDIEGAIKDFTKVIENLEKTKGVIIYDGAIKIFSACTQAYFERGSLYFSLSKYNEAIDDFSKAIEIDKGNAEIFNMRGEAKRLKSDVEGALKDLNRALALDPRFAEAFYNRSRVKTILGDIESARLDIQEAIDLGYKIENQKLDKLNSPNP